MDHTCGARPQAVNASSFCAFAVSVVCTRLVLSRTDGARNEGRNDVCVDGGRCLELERPLWSRPAHSATSLSRSRRHSSQRPAVHALSRRLTDGGKSIHFPYPHGHTAVAQLSFRSDQQTSLAGQRRWISEHGEMPAARAGCSCGDDKMLTAISLSSYAADLPGPLKVESFTQLLLSSSHASLDNGAIVRHAHGGCSTSTAGGITLPHHQISQQQPPTASSSRRCARHRLNLTDSADPPSE